MAEALDVILRFFKGEVITERTEWYNFVGAVRISCLIRSRTRRSRWSVP